MKNNNAKKIILAVLIIGIVIMMPTNSRLIKTVIEQKNNLTVVIDPGHGGPDSGAVASDGTEEKEINLKICKYIEREAEKRNINTVMTRTEDVGLFMKDETEGKWTKINDLKRRMEIINDSDADIVISVHLNSFMQDKNVRGAQVFYPKSEGENENKKIAEFVQNSLKNGIADGSDRIVLPKSDMYLFKNTKSNIILIECGFLSNDDDKKKLQTREFQQEISVYIINGIMEYYSQHIRKYQKINNV